ncbi:MAG: hypothetical protein EA401_13700 [Planctomycetota bacterium]|nr:MAG: hypothetical protein EA401_13700 [Planctomycetota bacterium]
MIDFASVCLLLGALLIVVGVFLRRLHHQRSKEAFIILEADFLDDISQGPMTGLGGGLPDPTTASGPLRFRFHWQGQERIDNGGNPWGLPAIPQLRQGNTLRIYFSEQRDRAFTDVRTTLIAPHIPWRLGWTLLAFAILLMVW